MNDKTALIIGASGATGKPLLEQLLNDDHFSQVIVFVRKNLPIQHAKLTQHIIDFDNVASWQDLVQGDVLFSCLGTTLKDAGSKDAQRKVDYDYQYNFARIAKQNAVASYVLVSAMMADPQSPFFYSRIKGELEQSVQALNFERCIILRPSMLSRPDTNRLGEQVAEKALSVLGRFKMLKKHRPLPTQDLAQAMRIAEQRLQQGNHILDITAIQNLLSH
ncbi:MULTISPECIES: NAD(P)H-binding protein [unclassified Acinetobacter]|uniref:NAD(P)H-binding protein n=1 Tax=unclassified Acinetobacter TaxID=196816 RepID=UPI0035BB0761